MKTLLKIFFASGGLIATMVFVVRAQDDLLMSTSTDVTNLSKEQLLQLRKEILDKFGLPTDRPMSIFNQAKGNPLGFKPPDFGPLNDLAIDFDKQSFEPGATLQATAKTYSADPNTITFVWYVNGKKVAAGKGATSAQFTLGDLGSASALRLVATTNEGKTKEIARTLRPAQTYFTWQASSYTPSWYRGKALPAPGSSVTIIAVPDFWVGNTKLSAADLLYTWKVNGSTTGSGRGKNFVSVSLAPYGQGEVSVMVDIKDDQERFLQQKFVSINPGRVSMLLYAEEPLYGLMTRRALTSTSLEGGNDIMLRAEPFFFPLTEVANSIFSWSINGSRIETAGRRTFRLGTSPLSEGAQTVAANIASQRGFIQGSSKVTINVTKSQ